MNRDMIKTVNTIKGKGMIPDHYDITVPELNALHAMVHTGSDGEYNALTTAFDYGFILGARAQKAGELQVSSTKNSMSDEKRFYVDHIDSAIKECNDIELLDLVWKLLVKSNFSAK